MKNCLYHINSKKEASVGWHSHLCSIKVLSIQSFVKLHLSASGGETGNEEILDLAS